MNRKREQAELISKLGQLLGPLLRASARPDMFEADEPERLAARFFVEEQSFRDAIDEFVRGEAGHHYVRQRQLMMTSLSELSACLATKGIGHDSHGQVELCEQSIINAVLTIPIPIDSTIHEARTPFSTYCFVKDLCSMAGDDIVWLDRYFDHTIFHRFLSDLKPTVLISLVTLPATSLRTPGDRQRHAGFIDISRLFAQERGPKGYNLIENANFHDRWLNVDKKLFVLGGSIKDISKMTTFTISRLDSSPENFVHLAQATSGTVVFGPNNPQHP